MGHKPTVRLYSNLFIRLFPYLSDWEEKAGQLAIGTELFWRWLVIS